jgi:hypothetical protein
MPNGQTFSTLDQLVRGVPHPDLHSVINAIVNALVELGVAHIEMRRPGSGCGGPFRQDIQLPGVDREATSRPDSSVT